MVEITDGWIARSKELTERAIANMPEYYESVYSKNRVELVQFNAAQCAKSAILRGMLALRVDGEPDTAMGYFQRGAELAGELVSAVEKFRISRSLSSKPQPFGAGGFELPIYVCLLANQFALAEKLATAITSPDVVTPEDEPDYVRTRILAAVIRNDSADYRFQQSAFDRIPLSEQIFGSYVQLCKCIAENDTSGFDALLRSVESEFSARARRKELENSVPIYGGSGYNEVVFDFMATGLAKLAIHRGMNINLVDSVYLPREIINA